MEKESPRDITWVSAQNIGAMSQGTLSRWTGYVFENHNIKFSYSSTTYPILFVNSLRSENLHVLAIVVKKRMPLSPFFVCLLKESAESTMVPVFHEILLIQQEKIKTVRFSFGCGCCGAERCKPRRKYATERKRLFRNCSGGGGVGRARAAAAEVSE